MFTKARLSLITWIQSQPAQFSVSVLIFYSHLCPSLQSGLFPSGFHTKILYAFLFSTTRATCPAPLVLLNSITQTMPGSKWTCEADRCNIFCDKTLHTAALSSRVLPLMRSTEFRTHTRQQTILQLYTSLCSCFYTAETRHSTPDLTAAAVSWVESVPNLFMNAIFIFWGFPNIWTLAHFQSTL